MNTDIIVELSYQVSKLLVAGFACGFISELLVNEILPAWFAAPLWSLSFVIMLRSITPILKIAEGHHTEVETRWI